MTRHPHAGLIGAGKFADDTLFRALVLSEKLGPVKAPSLRVASRIANTLRAGYAVATFEDFERCDLILISVPDRLLCGTVVDLSSLQLNFRHTAIVLCSAQFGSDELEPLAKRGAHTGSLCAIPGFESSWVMVEGDHLVERQVGELIDKRATRITVIGPSLKPLYLAALTCTSSLFGSMLATASATLKKAGISESDASTILQRQIERSKRAYFKAGRRTKPAEKLIGLQRTTWAGS